jgi:hypothetical protein
MNENTKYLTKVGIKYTSDFMNELINQIRIENTLDPSEDASDGTLGSLFKGRFLATKISRWINYLGAAMEEYNSCLQKEEDKLKLEGYDEYDSRQVQVDLEDRATVQSILNIINSYDIDEITCYAETLSDELLSETKERRTSCMADMLRMYFYVIHDLVQKKHLFRPGRMSQDDIKDFVKDNFDSFYVD